MLQPGQTDEKHKFMVQSIFVPDDYNKLETKEEKKEFVAELWKSPAENPVMSSKLLCNFLKPDEQVMSMFMVVENILKFSRKFNKTSNRKNTQNVLKNFATFISYSIVFARFQHK